MCETVNNACYCCIGSKHSPNHTQQSYEYVLHHPHRPRETAEPEHLSASSPEDQDGEKRGEDESQAATGYGANESNEVVKVRHRQSNASCREREQITH